MPGLSDVVVLAVSLRLSAASELTRLPLVLYAALLMRARPSTAKVVVTPAPAVTLAEVVRVKCVASTMVAIVVLGMFALETV